MLRLRSAPGGIVEHGVSAPLNDRGVNWPLSGVEVAVLMMLSQWVLRLRSAPGKRLRNHGVSAPLNGRGVTTLNGCGASTTLSDRSGGRGVNWPLSGVEVAFF